jgi:hypothetical protein
MSSIPPLSVMALETTWWQKTQINKSKKCLFCKILILPGVARRKCYRAQGRSYCFGLPSCGGLGGPTSPLHRA